jgi:3-hydroxybutyryl-CoA dehydrogenase
MTIAGFSKIGVIGAGQMGAGIAQVCATFGLHVILVDVAQKSLEKARAVIGKSLSKLVSKGQLTQDDAGNALQHIKLTTDSNQFSDADLVIEAAIENENIKRDIFHSVDEILQPEGIIATNTSSISITRLASYTRRPESIIGMHFMNPVPLMKLVEIIPGMGTSEVVTQRIKELAVGLGRETSTSQDYPGFVVNRILAPMINEAFTALMEGVSTPEDIDKAMTLGTNQPMGPLALGDFIGLDTCLAIMRVLHEGLGDPRYRPCPLLVNYVQAGWLGRKSGRGVYRYDK